MVIPAFTLLGPGQVTPTQPCPLLNHALEFQIFRLQRCHMLGDLLRVASKFI